MNPLHLLKDTHLITVFPGKDLDILVPYFFCSNYYTQHENFDLVNRSCYLLPRNCHTN